MPDPKEIASQQSLTHTDKVTPFAQVDAYIPAICEDITKAQHEVLIHGYKIDAGSDGEAALLEALQKLSAKCTAENRNVKVKILINKKTFPAAVVTNKTKSNAFQNKKISFPNLDLSYADHVHYAFGVYHSKFIVIDGRISYLNSGDFDILNNYKSEKPIYHCNSTRIENAAFSNNLRTFFYFASTNKQNRHIHGKSEPLQPLMNEVKQESDTEAIQFLSREANGYLYKIQKSPFLEALNKAINEALYKIEISTTNLNDANTVETIIQAVMRGIEVKLTLSKHMNQTNCNRISVPGDNTKTVRKIYSELAIRHCSHYDKLHIHWTLDDEGNIPKERGQGSNHTKLAIIDNKTFVGSSCLDKQSKNFSQEVDACITGAETAKQFSKTVFEPIFNKGVDVYTRFLEEQISNEPLALYAELKRLLEHSINTLQSTIAATPFARDNDDKATMEKLLGSENNVDSLKGLYTQLPKTTDADALKRMDTTQLRITVTQFKEHCETTLSELKGNKQRCIIIKILHSLWDFITSSIHPNPKQIVENNLRSSLKNLSILSIEKNMDKLNAERQKLLDNNNGVKP